MATTINPDDVFRSNEALQKMLREYEAIAKREKELAKRAKDEMKKEMLGTFEPYEPQPQRKPAMNWKKFFSNREEALKEIDQYVDAAGSPEGARRGFKQCNCPMCEALLELFDEDQDLSMQQDTTSSPGDTYHWRLAGQPWSYKLKPNDPLPVVDILERLIRIANAGRRPEIIHMQQSTWNKFNGGTQGVWTQRQGATYMFGVKLYLHDVIMLNGERIPYKIRDDRGVDW